MDKRTEAMIALGAAIGANCIPCFDFLYGKAKEANLSDEDIQNTIETAFKVKNGAQAFLKAAVGETTSAECADVETPCCASAASSCC